MFTGAHHVAVAVKNLDKALEFYQGVLGLRVGTRADVPEQGVLAALLPLPNGEIELLEPSNPKGGVAKFVEKRGEGAHHLCVQTTDIAEAIERAKGAGLPLIDQSPRKGLAGTIGFLHPGACQGVLVEMAQPGETTSHAAPSADGVAAQAIQTIYIGVKELETAKAAYVKCFGGQVGPVATDPRFGTNAVPVTIGRSSLTLLEGGALEAQPPAERFLAGRPEGLIGICLRVADLDAALGHLRGCGISAALRGERSGGRMARIDSDRTHGLNVYLC